MMFLFGIFFFPGFAVFRSGFGVLTVREIVGEQGEKENREAKTKKEKMD